MSFTPQQAGLHESLRCALENGKFQAGTLGYVEQGIAPVRQV
jgi:hypothetical protein